MITQHTIQIGPYPYGFHIITDKILSAIGDLPEKGFLHVFIQHTSAGITVNENADPDVLHDFRLYFDTMVPNSLKGMRHTIEGPDDMSAHIKASMLGSSVTLPITGHQLNLGTWQGIYLGEFRTHARKRTLLISIYS